jgi:reactive intermediate/imine deaminase
MTGRVLASAMLLVLACAGSDAANRSPLVFHRAPDPALAALPFSEAVRSGGLLFVSGQIGNRPGSLELVSGGIGPETRQALENIRDILERRGSSLDRVVKCTVFLADMAEWPAMNEVYVTFFPKRPPARSALAASGLALDARLEIECIAAVADGSNPSP